MLSHCFTPFQLWFAPDQLSKEFYFIVFSLPLFFFLLFFSLPFFFPSLKLGFTSQSYWLASPIFSELFFFTVDTSYSLFALFSILIPVLPLLNYIQLVLLSTLLYVIYNFAPICLVPFKLYFKSDSILFSLLTPLFPSPFCVRLIL